MNGKKAVLNHREVSRQGGVARAKKLTALKRTEIARSAGRKSAAKRQDKKVIEKLRKLAQFFKDRYLRNGTNISGLLLSIAHDLEEQENEKLN